MSWFTIAKVSWKMSDLTMPCQNCGVGVPSDVWAEELGFCVPCQHEFFDHLPEGFCGHFVRSCPFGDDCNSFCPVCEGGGDYCRICCDYPVELLPRAGDVS